MILRWGPRALPSSGYYTAVPPAGPVICANLPAKDDIFREPRTSPGTSHGREQIPDDSERNCETP